MALPEGTREGATAGGRMAGLRLEPRLFARIAGGVVVAAFAALMLAPRPSPFYLGILGLMATGLILRGRPGERLLDWSDPLVATAGIFSVYAAASALWAADSAEALKLAALFALAIVWATIVIAWIMRAEGERLARLGLALLIGFSIGLAYLAIEMATGQALKRFLFNTIEATRPDGIKNVRIKHGLVTGIHLNTLNRNVAALCLLAFPAWLVAGLWPGERMRRSMLLAFPIGVAVVVALSAHETSKLALIAGVLVLLLHRLAPARTWQGLRIAWIVAVAAIVPLALAASNANLQEASWIQSTGRARIAYWGVTAAETLRSPWIGVGAASTRIIDDEMKVQATQSGGAAPGRRTGRHAHNVYLQTWFELGLLGALGMLASGLIVLSRWSRMPDRVRPTAAATFAVAMTMAGFSWGLWQPWFLPTFLLAGIAFVIAARVAERDALAFFARNDNASRTT